MTSYHLNYILKEAIISKKKNRTYYLQVCPHAEVLAVRTPTYEFGVGGGVTIQPLRVLCSSVAMVAEYICGQYTFDC